MPIFFFYVISLSSVMNKLNSKNCYIIISFLLLLISCGNRIPGNTTLLHWSVRQGHGDITRNLLDFEGADHSPLDNQGLPPLYYAVKSGDSPMVELLLEKGADPLFADKGKTNYLHLAAREGHPDLVKRFLSYQELLSAVDEKGYLPLTWSYKKNHREVVLALVDAGSPVDRPDEKGYTLLHWACEEGEKGIVASLIDKKVDLNVIDKAGYLPIHLAAANEHPDIVKLLISNGADVSVPWPEGSLW